MDEKTKAEMAKMMESMLKDMMPDMMAKMIPKVLGKGKDLKDMPKKKMQKGKSE